MSKPVYSILNVNSTPDTRIRNVRRLRGNLGEQWGNIDMGVILYDGVKLHRIWRTGNGKRYVGIVSHWNMNRRFKLELWQEDIAQLETALGIQIAGHMVFSEPLEIQPRQYKGRMFKGIALIPAMSFTESVQTELTPLAKQSAIETICHYDSRVTNVHSSFDVMLNPTIRIECHTKHKAAIESAIAAYNDGSVAITWKLVGKPAFYGKFEDTEKIPVLKHDNYPIGLPNEKEIDVAILLTITTGILLIESEDGGFPVARREMSWFVGEEVYTQAAKRVADEIIPYLIEWYPQLNVSKETVRANGWQKFLADFRKQHGDTLMVAPIPQDDHTSKTPEQDLIDLGFPASKIMKIDLSDDDEISPYGTLPKTG